MAIDAEAEGTKGAVADSYAKAGGLLMPRWAVPFVIYGGPGEGGVDACIPGDAIQ